MQGDASIYPAFGAGAAAADFGAGGPYGGPLRAGGASALASGGGGAPSATWGAGGAGAGALVGLPGVGGVGGGVDVETDEDFAQEPPLIEELGISFVHIRTKLTAVLLLNRPVPPDVMADSDMAGPLVFCLALGFFLLLQGEFL
jgi:hypothetical protein